MFHGLTNLSELDITLTGIGNNSLNKNLFKYLVSLERLLIGSNCYTELTADTFDHLVNLKRLNLSYAMVEYLPEKLFTKLTKLEALYLSPSKLKRIPNAALRYLNLRILYLGGNFTSEIVFDQYFNNGTKLRTLAMNGCMPVQPLQNYCIKLTITNKTFEFVNTYNFMYYQQLGLDYDGIRNLLSHPPATTFLGVNWVHGLAGTALSPALFQGWTDRIRNIEKLDLSHLAIIGIKNNTFANFTSLKTLSLSNNQLLNIMLERKAFWGLGNLEILDLTSNVLSSIPDLTSFTSLNCTLKDLQLSYNQFNEVIDGDVFRNMPHLEKLHLANTNIGDRTVESLVNMTNLKYLNLAGNRFEALTSLVTGLSTLNDVESLDLSGNYFVPSGSSEDTSLSKLKKLKSLTLSGYGVDLYMLSGVTSLQELSLVNPADFDLVASWKINHLYFPNLTQLSISGSRMTLDKDMMKTMPNLTHLNLPNNRIDVLDRDSLVDLHKVEYIDLTGNDIKEITGKHWKLSYLETLILNGNKLATITKDVINNKYLSNLKTLDVSHNSLDCDCDLTWFRTWIYNDTVVETLNYDSYMCTTHSSNRVMLLQNFDPTTLQCKSMTYIYVAVSLSCIATLFIVIASICVYYRWHIRYAIFLIRCKVRGYSPIPETDKEFDAFVSYNSKDQKWVLRTLVPHLEKKCSTKFKICVDYKSFIPGKFIVDNIMDSIENSRKTLLVLSPNFVKSEWCYFEMQMAHHRLFEDQRDVVILLLLEDIPDKDVPRMLRKLLLNKTYIMWPKEECSTARELFWAKLEEALKMPSVVDRIHSV
ncbi:toll-like receptor 2 [Glandiceps talaboti]